MKAHKIIVNNAWNLALLIIWCMYLLALSITDTWNYIGVPAIRDIKFADLQAILSAIDCDKNNIDVFYSNPCDPMGRVHVYGKSWLWLGKAGLNLQDINWLGSLISMVFMLFTIYIVNPKNFFEFTFSSLLLFSPAVTLGLERSNNDLIIFLLLGVSSFLISKKRLLLSFLLIYISISLKIYPVVILWSLLFISQTKKEFYSSLIMASFLTSFWLITNFDELKILSHTVPKPSGHYVTGAKEFFKIINIYDFSSIINILITTFVASIISIFLSTKIKKQYFDNHDGYKKQLFFIVGYAILISTFLMNTNYDYRWIFAIMTMPYIFSIWKSIGMFNMSNYFILVYFILLMIVVWSELLMGTSHFSIDNLFVIKINLTSLQVHMSLMPLIKQISAWGTLILLTAFALNLPVVKKGYLSTRFK